MCRSQRCTRMLGRCGSLTAPTKYISAKSREMSCAVTRTSDLRRTLPYRPRDRGSLSEACRECLIVERANQPAEITVDVRGFRFPSPNVHS